MLQTNTLPVQGIKPLIKAKILAERKAFRDSQFRQWLLRDPVSPTPHNYDGLNINNTNSQGKEAVFIIKYGVKDTAISNIFFGQ